MTMAQTADRLTISERTLHRRLTEGRRLEDVLDVTGLAENATPLLKPPVAQSVRVRVPVGPRCRVEAEIRFCFEIPTAPPGTRASTASWAAGHDRGPRHGPHDHA